MSPRGFKERSPENLEKIIGMVEEFQTDESSAGAEAKEGQEYLSQGQTFSLPTHDLTLTNDFTNDTAHESLSESSRTRSRTPIRLKYEAEVEVIKKQVGDLEDIRKKLGLSRRKMCQLLMVDPSAWTRWSKEGAPPHIYRALEWYMLLSKEAPHQAHSYWISTVGGQMRTSNEETPAIKNLKHETFVLLEQVRGLNQKIQELLFSVEKLKGKNRKLGLALWFAVAIAIASLLIQMHLKG